MRAVVTRVKEASVAIEGKVACWASVPKIRKP